MWWNAYTRFAAAIAAALDTLDALPDVLQRTSLGDGFSFLLAPLEDSAGSDVRLTESALAPGARLRAVLAEEGVVSRDDDDDAAWQRGLLDLTTWPLPPGRDSPYMQAVYGPLFGQDW